MKSDAFATGQTLVRPRRSPGFTAERPEIRRGIDFLVATQKPDGSWPMTSRATPDGSPGSATLLTPITCAASSWATLGLARLVPNGRTRRRRPPPLATMPKIPTRVAGTYRGGELVELRVRGRLAYLIKPTSKVDPHRRWVWDFPFWLAINDGFGNVAHRYYVEQLLAAGFHVAGVDVGPSCGSPAAADGLPGILRATRLGAWVAQAGSGPGTQPRRTDRVRLGVSPSGLRGPDRGDVLRRPTSARIRPCPTSSSRPTKGLDYGLSLVELDRRAGEFNPIDNLAPLAKAGVKILHLHGDEDVLVPTGANSTELARRYRELGGEAEIVLLKGLGAERANSRGHDGPELYESAALLKFLLAD